MFVYSVQNQVVNTLTEIGLPCILRWVDNHRNGRKNVGGGRSGSPSKKKQVVFQDEVKSNSETSGEVVDEKEGKEDREF